MVSIMDIKGIIKNTVEDLMRDRLTVEFIKNSVELAFEKADWESILEDAIASQIDDIIEDAIIDAAEEIASEVTA